MPITTGYSSKQLPDAVVDLQSQCGGREPRVVIYFASPKYDPAELSLRMRGAFPEARLAGCTSAGEFGGGKMMSHSLSAIFLDAETVKSAGAAVVENLRKDVSISDAFAKLEREVGTAFISMDIEKYVGVILVDGLSGAEETLLEKIGDRTDVLFVGGSAGDDLQFQHAHVMVDGAAFENAAVLLVLELEKGFDILKTQSLLPLGKRLVATKVDPGARVVLEFDGRPAVEAYAAALGVPPEDAPASFMTHPLGLMINGDPFVRSPQRVQGTAIAFYCRIEEGMELEVLTSTDIVAHTREAIEVRKRNLAISGIIDFQCILRTLQLRAENHCEQYGAIFDGIPCAGFSTYGEAYLGHMNQTSTMLLLR
jgi:hypothetical protein